MGLRILVAAALTAIVALAPTAAGAKGAKEMAVSGPGLAAPIRLANTGGAAISPNTIAVKSGLLTSTADRLSSARPRGELGPRYAATYDWLIGPSSTAPLRQELYPFAEGGSVAYTPARQHAGGAALASGWYRAGAELTLLLVAAGVPLPVAATPPAAVAAPPHLTG